MGGLKVLQSVIKCSATRPGTAPAGTMTVYFKSVESTAPVDERSARTARVMAVNQPEAQSL